MTRQIFIFLGTFVAGALIALVARAAWFEPHAAKDADPAGGGDYAPMVSNTLAPAKTSAPAPKPAADEHAGHGAPGPQPTPAPAAAGTTAAAGQPVNTVCAICGMDVDPKIPTATYQGKTIGFGCKLCPPKFAKDPDRWGPLYLKNETAQR